MVLYLLLKCFLFTVNRAVTCDYVKRRALIILWQLSQILFGLKTLRLKLIAAAIIGQYQRYKPRKLSRTAYLLNINSR